MRIVPSEILSASPDRAGGHVGVVRASEQIAHLSEERKVLYPTTYPCALLTLHCSHCSSTLRRPTRTCPAPPRFALANHGTSLSS